MSTEKKTIQIHPDLFNLSTSKTRKKRKNVDGDETHPHTNNPIRVKPHKQETNKTVRNRILKYIREQQQLKEQQGGFDLPPITSINPLPNNNNNNNNNTKEEEKTQFEESLDFMKTFAENNRNRTLKERSYGGSGDGNQITNVLSVPSVFNQALEQPDLTIDAKQGETFVIKPASMPQLTTPIYGCMKGGTLPTYRTWTNQTQRNHLGNNTPASFSSRPPSLENMTMTSISRANIGETLPPPTPLNVLNSSLSYSAPNNNVIGGNPPLRNVQSIAPKQLEIIKEMNMRNKQMEQQKREFVRRKQKRIIRRTYRVGKSKKYPRVSVLVSNKNIRRNTTTKIHEIKQIPVEDVKRKLIKHGFIKAGSTAPIDVLRKMYESMTLIGGEIENHNPDYLLHNYLAEAY